MAGIRFYTDEHVSKSLVRALRRRGVEVLTAPEAGMLAASDEEHLKSRRGHLAFAPQPTPKLPEPSAILSDRFAAIKTGPRRTRINP